MPNVSQISKYRVLTHVGLGNDMALHPSEVLHRQMHDVYVFARRAARYYASGLKRWVHKLTRMT